MLEKGGDKGLVRASWEAYKISQQSSVSEIAEMHPCIRSYRGHLISKDRDAWWTAWKRATKLWIKKDLNKGCFTRYPCGRHKDGSWEFTQKLCRQRSYETHQCLGDAPDDELALVMKNGRPGQTVNHTPIVKFGTNKQVINMMQKLLICPQDLL